MEAAQGPICRWVDKQLWNIYTVEYDWAIKKGENLLFVIVWMDLENIVLSEINQIPYDFTHI